MAKQRLADGEVYSEKFVKLPSSLGNSSSHVTKFNDIQEAESHQRSLTKRISFSIRKSRFVFARRC